MKLILLNIYVEVIVMKSMSPSIYCKCCGEFEAVEYLRTWMKCCDRMNAIKHLTRRML